MCNGLPGLNLPSFVKKFGMKVEIPVAIEVFQQITKQKDNVFAIAKQDQLFEYIFPLVRDMTYTEPAQELQPEIIQ